MTAVALPKLLGVLDDGIERMRADDRARDDAMGFLVFEAIHDENLVLGPAGAWAVFPGELRADYIAAARAVEDRLEEDAQEYIGAAERHEEALREIWELIEDDGRIYADSQRAVARLVADALWPRPEADRG